MKATTNKNEPAPQHGTVKGGLIIIAFVIAILIFEAMAIVHAALWAVANYGYWPAVAVVAVLMILFGLLFN